MNWLTRLAAAWLAKRGAAKRRASVRERCRQMRRELGLPDHPGLAR